MSQLMVRGFAEGVKLVRHRHLGVCTAEGTLLLRDLRFAHIWYKPRVRCTAPRVVHPGIREAQVAIHGAPDIVGVEILLPIVLPPADRAQGHCARRVHEIHSKGIESEPEPSS